jgi:glycosyltransferase involved in cell wall biosynthesis
VKLLVVSHLYPSPAQHHPLFVHEQVRELRAAGVEARVLCPTPYAPRVLWSVPRLRERGQRPLAAQIEDVPVAYPRVVAIPRKVLFARAGDLYYAGLRPFVPALRRRGCDLIHAHPAFPDGAAAVRLAHDLGVPLVITVHGADAHHSLAGGGAVAARTIATLRAAAAVVTVSAVLAERLADAVPAERLYVIPNGVSGADGQVKPADLLPGRRLIVSVGRLAPGKGHEQVLAALALLGDAYGDVHYAVAGTGPLARQLARRADELGLGARVHWLGHLPQGEAFALMARADVFALPSSPEGFGLVHAEAMRQGTPTIACAGEGPASFIADGTSGLLVPSGNVAALAATVARLLDDPVAAGKIGAAGQRAVAALTWAENARRQLDVYRLVLGERGGDSA